MKIRVCRDMMFLNILHWTNLTKLCLGIFWRPEEVSLQKDRADYQNFRPEQKHIFTSNLKYQTLLDSVQGRGPSLAFLPYVSNPELEGCIVTWDFFETIHSRSYTHITVSYTHLTLPTNSGV